MGTVIRLVVALAFVGFLYASFLGRGKAYGKYILRLTFPIVVVTGILSFIRGAWIPNAGGGLAVDREAAADIVYEDHAVSIPVNAVRKDAFSDCEDLEEFDHCLEYYIAHTSSETYSPEFSRMMISLCNSVYDPECIDQAYDNLGFPDGEQNREFHYGIDDIILTYEMCKKQLAGGTEIVLITARGTGDDKAEIVNNFNVVVNHYGRHSGFADAADKLHKCLMGFLGNDANFSNTIFVLTGYSRGAAVINIIAAMLADEGIPQSHIYCYTFACPDTAFLSDEDAEVYSCIYNINNVNDIVSWTPWNIWKESGFDHGFGRDTHWNKYGKSFWYSESDWKGGLNAGIDNFNPEHYQTTYLDFLRKEKAINEYKMRWEASSLIDMK